MIFVARKHLRWWQVPTHAFGFAIRHIGFYTALRVWRRDFRALWAVYRGLGKGLSTPLSSDEAVRIEANAVENH
jgi:1-acyl-sn-glycerol-3-phosphate acyltransferase